MMKSFFKKLAFVMALAMVVTTAAPAAQAVAAEKALAITYQNEKTYSISEVNIKNVGATEDLKFLWAPSNWKELGVKWSSSNENIVTVDANGVVTAVAAGSATVSVAVGTQTASVTVNVAELPAYTVSIGEGSNRSVTEWELEIGESVDFAFYGIKDYALDTVGALPRYLCTWQSDDTTVLTKDNEAGLFTAVAAGTAKVTLTVANVLTGQTHNVIPVAVTVKAPEVVVTEQNIVADLNKTQDTIEIDLGSNAGLNIKNVEVFRVFFADDDYDGDGDIDDQDIDRPYETIYVEDVKWNSATGKWEVITFDDFIDGVTYEVKVSGYKAERFVASVGPVARVEVFEKANCKASLATDDLPLVPTYVEVKLYDAKGVDVTNRIVNGVKNNDEANVRFYLGAESLDYAMTGYNEVEFYDMTTAAVIAVFDNGGEEVESVDPCLLTPEMVEEYGIKRVVSWTLVNEEAGCTCGKNHPTGAHVNNWETEVSHAVPAGEYGYVIVTLLEDTRGVYFTTHEASATALTGVQFNGKDVYYTEDVNKAFWIYGNRVEYRAMNPDKMIVEDFGEVASYEEGNARFALYLYNQNGDADEFVKELYSQYVNVCCPMEMTDMKATTAAVEITMNTEHDDEADGISLDAENAYYSIWSTGSIEVKLLDTHTKKWGKEVPAKKVEAKTANFKVELVSSALPGEATTMVDVANTPADDTDDVDTYTLLKTIVEDMAYELNDGTDNWKRSISIEAHDFANIFAKRTTIKIKITEEVTKDTATVTITLRRPELEIEDTNPDGTPIYGESAALGTIDEYTDELKTDLETFEKYTIRNKNLSVDQSKGVKANLMLFQVDKTGKEIGVDNNLYVSKVLYTEKNGVSQVKKTDIYGATDTLKVGDRVVFVKDSDGKAYGDPNVDYKNPAYTTKKVWDQYPIDPTAKGLGVTIDKEVDKIDGKTISPYGGAAFKVNQYEFKFVTTGTDGELVFAKPGRYSVTIKTVKAINDTTGVVTFTKNTGLTSSLTIQVENNKKEVTLVKRELTRIEDAYMSTYFDAYTKNLAYGDDADVKALILQAFDFSIADSAADILYYTYTIAPTNKQVIINDVVFKVQVDALGGWYRSTATVNKSLTFDYE